MTATSEDRTPPLAPPEPPPGYDEMPSEWPDYPRPENRDPPPPDPDGEPDKPRQDNRSA